VKKIIETIEVIDAGNIAACHSIESLDLLLGIIS
jgi:hypothetical protein